MTLRKAGRVTAEARRPGPRPGVAPADRPGRPRARRRPDPLAGVAPQAPSPFARAIWWTYRRALRRVHGRGDLRPEDRAGGERRSRCRSGCCWSSVGAATAPGRGAGAGGARRRPGDAGGLAADRAGRSGGGHTGSSPGWRSCRACWSWPGACSPHAWGEVLAITGLVVGLVLAYGAVMVGLGLLVAIAQPRPGRAAAIAVAGYLAVTVAYPAVVLPMYRGGPGTCSPLWPSPFFGILRRHGLGGYGGRLRGHGDSASSPGLRSCLADAGAWSRLALLGVALGGLDRGLGRVADRSGPSATGRAGGRGGAHSAHRRDREVGHGQVDRPLRGPLRGRSPLP